MKLLDALREQVQGLGPLKRAWFTTFNLDISFFETHVLRVLLDADTPTNRMDYEAMQLELAEKGIDVRVFCDLRMMESDQLKRTAIPVHGVLPAWLGAAEFGKDSLFHPKVIYLEDEKGRMVLGAGSANLSVSGWGRNQEVFVFRRVSSNEQYKQIKRFFEPLFDAAGLEGHELERRRFDSEREPWRFVHSFEPQTFLDYLMSDSEVDQLAVWSPFFPHDLAGLLGRINERAGGKLKFFIVPDLVGNRHIRTLWTKQVESLLDEGTLTFHDRPSPRPEEIEMTHAKLWLTSGDQSRLAVGSWNFTEAGSASFALRNVEAGILLDVAPATQIAGRKLTMRAKDFCSEDTLETDELDPPPYPLPFELYVRFDWEMGGYMVDGRLHEEIEGKLYSLRVPGVKESLPLNWKARRDDGAWPLVPIKHEVPDNEALLADHCYEVWRNGSLEYRGLIQEIESKYRRAHGYDSLKDLLNDLVKNASPTGSGVPRLRQALRHDDVAESESMVPDLGIVDGELSYFRLFYAFEQFRARLGAVKLKEDLENLLFVYPGSLKELVGKVNDLVAKTDESIVFKWFLVQEAGSLYASALDAFRRCRQKYERTPSAEDGKWATLRPNINAVRLPSGMGINGHYMRKLRELCAYGR